MRRRTAVIGIATLLLLVSVAVLRRVGSPLLSRVRARLFGGRTVDDVAARYGAPARRRFSDEFALAHVSYPPERVTLIGLKREKRLELWASNSGAWRRVKTYDVCEASGVEGPKLREGDLQVPEGVYALTVLNPNSGFHLSIRVDYPNEFDRAMAVRDGRSDLGGDIYIHGKCVSIGCLAMGDETIEELFVLAHDVGLANMEAIIAPADFRDASVVVDVSGMPAWTPRLYGTLRAALAPFGSGNTLR